MEDFYIALVGLVGVLVGALITVFKDIYLQHRTNLKAQQYLAIRVVSLLDEFIEGCISVSIDRGRPGKDGYFEAESSEPNLDIESLDVDWKSIPSSLMYKILGFPALINRARNNIQAVAEYQGTPPEYSEVFAERRIEYGKLGLTANNIAESIRTQYKIEPRKYDNWDPIGDLQRRLDEIQRQRDEYYERQKKMVEKHLPNESED